MAKFRIILRNKINKQQMYPIILRINKLGNSKIITLGISCKKEHWDPENALVKKGDKNNLQKNAILIELYSKAERIIANYEREGIIFSSSEFVESFRGKERNNITVIGFFEEQIQSLIIAGKISAAQPLINTKTSLLKFSGSNVKFRELTPTFLRRYEAFLRGEGNSEGGIAFKMREVRALFNDAIDQGFVSYDIYPFRGYKISKLKSTSRKIALSEEDMILFKSIDLSNRPHLINSHKYFLFSYYMRGMNFQDMMHLKWNDIKSEKLYYNRSKTNKKFVIKIMEPVYSILEHFSDHGGHESFIFPILLKDNMTPQQLFNRKHKVLRRYNKDLQEIARLAGIKDKVTSYVARHSYATHMKLKGVAVEVISESMGHSSIQVTMAYLKDFQNDFLDEENEKLLKDPTETYNGNALGIKVQ